MIESIVRQEPRDVNRRLAELQVGPRPRLLEVARVAISAAAGATPFHASNAAGTYAYHEGTFALRDEFVDGVKWRAESPIGVEVISNNELKLRISFANVDVACDNFRKPKPRSKKGSGAERVCTGDLFGGNLPEYAPRPLAEWALYYLMVDERGAVELTRPVIRNDTFVAYPERIYLADGSDLFGEPIREDDDVPDNFDPLVIRK